jgi:hypothetical protein
VTRRRRRLKHLLDGLKEDSECWTLRAEALWRTRFGSGFVSVVRRLRIAGIPIYPTDIFLNVFLIAWVLQYNIISVISSLRARA